MVEAAARSGALNTASWAADRGIPVMAVPGDVDRPKVAGCLALIRDGATLVRDSADVLVELGLQPMRSRSAARGPAAPRDPLADAILSLLDEGPAEADRVVAALDIAPAVGLARLGELVAAGSVVAGDDGRFRRSER